ncbi:hypothetical protein DFH09DRAFT_1080350 [Mycena vulgaris]|nr:hypothetical protein DFH09DRAFT_1080350 [Mycena vulgaris]
MYQASQGDSCKVDEFCISKPWGCWAALHSTMSACKMLLLARMPRCLLVVVEDPDDLGILCVEATEAPGLATENSDKTTLVHQAFLKIAVSGRRGKKVVTLCELAESEAWRSLHFAAREMGRVGDLLQRRNRICSSEAGSIAGTQVRMIGGCKTRGVLGASPTEGSTGACAKFSAELLGGMGTVFGLFLALVPLLPLNTFEAGTKPEAEQLALARFWAEQSLWVCSSSGSEDNMLGGV